MKPAMVSVVIAALLLFSAPAAANLQKDHPIVGVIDLIKGLMATSESEGKTEAISYMKFEKWCADSYKTLNSAIAGEKQKIVELTEQIDGLTKSKNQLENEISEESTEIGNLEAALTKMTTDRNNENALYEEADSDLASTISAIDSAITALEGAQNTTHTFLLQQRAVQTVRALVSATATDDQLNALDGFLAQGRQQASAPAPAFSFSPAPRPEQLVSGDLAGHVKKYEFKSGSVIELLKELKYKFETEKLEGSKAETNAVNSYNLAKQANEEASSAATASKSAGISDRADVMSDLAQAKADKGSEESDLATDSGTLDATKSACKVKQEEWQQRSKIRNHEMEAMKAAVKILSKSTGVRTEAPSNPVPPPRPSSTGLIQEVSFLQVADPKMKAVNLLRTSARTTHNRALERLAQEISMALTGPFDQVNNKIEKMIFQLMAEQKEEDEHKAWCDQELKKTDEQKINKEEKIEDLQSKSSALAGTIGQLASDISDADSMVADITTHMKEATEIRQTGKKENMLAIKDAQKAQKSLADAIAVLESFYKESGMVPKEPYEFLQAAPALPDSPDTWDAPYTGVTSDSPSADGGSGGIIAILKANMVSFQQMESDTKFNEAEDQKEYDEEMSEAEIDKAGRQKESEVKTAEKKRQVAKKTSLDKTEASTNKELDAVKQYLKDLQPACVEGDSTYDLRKAARQKEMDALRQAQVILRDAFAAGPAPAAASFLQRRPVQKH